MKNFVKTLDFYSNMFYIYTNPERTVSFPDQTIQNFAGLQIDTML